MCHERREEEERRVALSEEEEEWWEEEDGVEGEVGREGQCKGGAEEGACVQSEQGSDQGRGLDEPERAEATASATKKLLKTRVERASEVPIAKGWRRYLYRRISFRSQPYPGRTGDSQRSHAPPLPDLLSLAL